MAAPGLSPSQKEAVMHGDGPALVLAGPGSGKTQVITCRTLALLQEYHVRPEHILVITFSKAAADQMRQRFHALLRERQGQEACPVSFGTFHAVFYTILRQAYHYTSNSILRENERLQIISNLADRYRLEGEDRRKLLQDISAEISRVVNEQTPLEYYYAASCGEETFRRLFADYQRIKEHAGKIDFDDMLLFTCNLLQERGDILAGWQKRFRYILIDEFQDINMLQYKAVRMLALPENNLFAVGDDDQSIYRFRGARPQIMLGFTKDYPDAKVLYLRENYRCPEEVVSCAAELIGHNRNRYGKQVICAAGSSRAVCRKPEEEVPVVRSLPDHTAQALYLVREIRKCLQAGIAPENMAILTRTNTGGRFIFEKLTSFAVPVRTGDSAPLLYDHWIAEDILSYIRLGLGGRDRRDMLQIMNRPLRYISRECLDTGTVSFDRLRMWYEDRPWMVRRISRMEEDLLLTGRMKPYAAVNYIRKGIGYDGFLEEYAKEHRIDPEELQATADELQAQAAGFETFAQWSAHIDRCREETAQREEKKEGVLLATLHSVKGLEFDTVFIPDVNEGVLPYRKAGLESDVEEERRLLYVGMTRARRQLHITYVRERFGKEQQPSRFIGELSCHLRHN